MRRVAILVMLGVGACQDPGSGDAGASSGGELPESGETSGRDTVDATTHRSTGTTSDERDETETQVGGTSGSDGAGTSSGPGWGDGVPPPVTTELSAFEDLQLGDLDGDGCADVVTSGTGQPYRLQFHRGSCDGGFSAPVVHEIPRFHGFTLGDIDGDGRVDVLARGWGRPPRVEAYLVGDAFELSSAVTSTVFTHDRMWNGDVDGDGRTEVLTHSSTSLRPTVHVWSGEGDGAFALLESSTGFTFDLGATGSLDDDAFVDFAAGTHQGMLTPWTSDGASGQLEARESSAVFVFDRFALGDVDGDGLDDLLTDVPGNEWRVSIYTNLGDGAFETPPIDFAAFNYRLLRVADVDGDLDDDIVLVPTGEPPRVMVWLPEP